MLVQSGRLPYDVPRSSFSSIAFFDHYPCIVVASIKVSQNKSGYIVRNGGLYREYVLLCIVRYNSCSVPMTPRFDTAGVDTIDVKTVR